MARITIEFDTATETLSEVLERLSPFTASDPLEYADEVEQTDAGVRQDAEPGERQRRRRRTKAEMEAARAAENGQASSGSATPAPTVTLGAEVSIPQTSAQPSNGGAVDDPFASPPTSAASPADTSARTLDDVRNAMSAWLGRDGHEAEGMRPLFAKFQSAEGDPCARASQLQAKDYAAFIDTLAA